MDSVLVSVNKLVEAFFWEVRKEYSLNKFEGTLTEVEESWARNKGDIVRVFGVSHASMKNLMDYNRPLSLNDYVKVKAWMKSYMSEDDKPLVDALVDSLLR